MALVFTEDQDLLRHSVREFVLKNSPLKRLRALRDSRDPIGFSPELWAEMGTLGWLGVTVPERYGGAGLGFMDLIVVMEELGRGLSPEPMLSTVLLAANALILAGSEQQKQSLLPRLSEGKLLLTLAAGEPRGRYERHRLATRADRGDGCWSLTGVKTLVPDAHVVDRLIIPARTSGAPDGPHGITLFLVSREAPGVGVTRQSTVDCRNAGMVQLESVRVTEADVLGRVDGGGEVLDGVIERATIGLCAEMLGSMLAAFEMTVEYLRTRTQFGVPIGSFQALKHRAAKMFIETELARSAVMGAADAVDRNRPDVSRLVSLAKARCSDAFILIGNESLQMHGGIGMTDEHDIGFFLKRARAAAIMFGDAAHHRSRYAELGGY
jgi:alkylation response protein AidB-like acyl-CoA dehydrogenase